MGNSNTVVKDQSARRRIREALIYQLKNIRKSGGYNYDLIEVHDTTPSIEQMKVFPSTVVVMGNESSLEFGTQGPTFKRIQKDLQVLLHVFLHTNMKK